MSWRRPLLLLLLVMLAVSWLSAPSRRDSGPSAPAPAAAAADQPPVIHATLPAADDVRVREGRVIELRVTSLEPDIARIDALGLQGPVGPDLDGPTLRFVAAPAGRYPVRLDVGGTDVGTIEVVAGKSP